MGRSWPRVAAALVFVLLLTVPTYVVAGTGWDGEVAISDGLAWAVGGGVFFATGFSIGRWWAIPLLAVPVLLVLPLGVDREDADQQMFAWLMLWGPILIGAPFLLLGLVVRVAGGYWRQRAALRDRSVGS